MGGKDDKENLVNLSAREHFIAHQLLYKIHKTYSLLNAITFMCSGRHGQRYTNRLYSWHRERFAEESSKHMKEYWANNPHPKGMLGKKHTEETLKQISEWSKENIKRSEIHKFSLEGKFIESFDSLFLASQSVFGNASNIKYCAEGKFQYAYGFRWSYSLTPTFDTVKPRNYKGARGKISINNGTKNKLINSNEPIPEGWVRGRVKVNK